MADACGRTGGGRIFPLEVSGSGPYPAVVFCLAQSGFCDRFGFGHSAVMETRELLTRISSLLRASDGHQVGILATADAKGLPHASYMGTVASPTIDHLLMMTAPDSRKAQNILENPQVEWLFCDEEREDLLCLRGTARVLENPVEVEEAWHRIPDKSRAYFLSYQDVGINFLIFETTIETFQYSVPRDNEVIVLTSEEMKKIFAEAK